jgi:hypothetical protein
MLNKIIYLFCINNNIDPVASKVLDYLKKNYTLIETDIIIDGYTVLYYKVKNNIYYFISLNNVLSHDYKSYYSVLNTYFSDALFGGIVNWHQGLNAPDKILTVHSTGDVEKGIFGRADGGQIKSIFLALERNRKSEKLLDFTTLIEGTHWSGSLYTQSSELILKIKFPIYDIEIGSYKNSWENPLAIKVLAKSLIDIQLYDQMIPSIIVVGGQHFENSFATFIGMENIKLSISHILPNQWINNEHYINSNGKDKLFNCINSVSDSVVAIVYHDGIKGIYKNLCRETAKLLGLSCFKHKKLKNLDNFQEYYFHK